MRQSLFTIGLAAAALGLAAPPSAPAQEDDFAALFSNDRFYDDNEVLQARGDVDFLADLWYLPGPADSTKVLVGVSLGNDALQFVRTSDGRWRADYRVRIRARGDTEFDETWEKSVDVGTFDETLLSGETIVFQSELALTPGEYDIEIFVRDVNADDASRVEREVVVPSISGGALALGEPVLLRTVQGSGPDASFIVHPSHYYADIPSAIEALVAANGATPDSAYTVRARLAPEGDDRDEPAAEWQQTVRADASGSIRTFASVPNDRPRFGEYVLNVSLDGPEGTREASTGLLIAGSSGWIIENWDKALSVIKYEATNREVDILEDVEEPERRIEAWNCFWSIRDPVPATAANEALQDYFRRIGIANANWTSALRPGYQSDRGRVYLTLGPPDNVYEEELPRESRPFEVWEYNRNNFRIIFTDRIGFDNYQIENVGTYQRELAVIERRKRTFLGERADQCPLLAEAYGE